MELKGLEYERRTVDLRAGEQRAADYLALNPQGLAPTLIVDGNRSPRAPPSLNGWRRPILSHSSFQRPHRARACARDRGGGGVRHTPARESAGDLLSTPRHGAGRGGGHRFARRWIEDGFAAIEGLIERGPGGPWAWGGAPTLRGLLPRSAALRRRSTGTDLRSSRRLAEIAAAAEAHPAFVAAHPKNQPDAPH